MLVTFVSITKRKSTKATHGKKQQCFSTPHTSEKVITEKDKTSFKMSRNPGSENGYSIPILRSTQERKYVLKNINSRQRAGIQRSTGSRVVDKRSNISNLDRRTSRVSPRNFDIDRVEIEPGLTNKSKKQSPQKSTKTKELNVKNPPPSVHEKLYNGEVKHMRPSQIRYTNDIIFAHFQDGTPMFATFKDILFGRVQIKYGGVPPIEIMKNENLYWVVNGNRRLYVFKNLEKCGAITTMPVLERRYDTVEIDKHFSTRNMGRSVAVLNDIHIEKKMEEQVKYWRDWKEKKEKEAKEAKTQKRKKDPGKSGCCVIS